MLKTSICGWWRSSQRVTSAKGNTGSSSQYIFWGKSFILSSQKWPEAPSGPGGPITSSHYCKLNMSWRIILSFSFKETSLGHSFWFHASWSRRRFKVLKLELKLEIHNPKYVFAGLITVLKGWQVLAKMHRVNCSSLQPLFWDKSHFPLRRIRINMKLRAAMTVTNYFKSVFIFQTIKLYIKLFSVHVLKAT
jgi:hypothetical protein